MFPIFRNHYLFECMCPKCLSDSANEPDVTSDDDDDDDEMDEDVWFNFTWLNLENKMFQIFF